MIRSWPTLQIKQIENYYLDKLHYISYTIVLKLLTEVSNFWAHFIVDRILEIHKQLDGRSPNPFLQLLCQNFILLCCQCISPNFMFTLLNPLICLFTYLSFFIHTFCQFSLYIVSELLKMMNIFPSKIKQHRNISTS